MHKVGESDNLQRPLQLDLKNETEYPKSWEKRNIDLWVTLKTVVSTLSKKGRPLEERHVLPYI
jgi:hypothetical protein